MRHPTRALALLPFLAIGCSADGETLPTDGSDNSSEEIRVCAAGGVLKGIDVSEHNGTIAWAKVKAAGNSFAFARVSDGLKSPDDQFAANWAGMKSAGLVRGVYQYFRPSQDPTAQADLLVAKVGTFGPGDLSPVIDVEDADGKAGATVVKRLRVWIDRVKAKTGRDPIIYTSSGFWDGLPSTAQFAGNTLWVANYTKLCPSMPKTWSDWAFWQSSESGLVPGLNGSFDIDKFNGTLADLQALAFMPAPTPGCTQDADCNHGATGTAQVCSNTGATAGTCVSGCHQDSDCPTGTTCDHGSWSCKAPTGPLPLGAPCANDDQCGAAGAERVCSSTSQTCIVGCHDDADCASGRVCDKSQSSWVCADPAPPPPTCPVLAFPSGVHIQTFEDAATTASYNGHLKAGETAPTCFIDTTHMVDPVAGVTYDLSVHVATHFQMVELVGTEVNQGYGHFVLVNPSAVQALENFRVGAGKAVTINSGYRSPKHQEDVCVSICGDPMGCPGLCANSSRHMWGDGYDLPMAFYTQQYAQLACQSGFKFVYLEANTHLHVDQNPAYASCVIQ